MLPALLLVAVAAKCGEGDRACRSQNDCPIGEACTIDGACVPLVIPDAGPRPDSGVPLPPGGGEREPSFDDRIEVEAPITMFVPGPTSSTAYLAQGRLVDSGYDRVDLVDLGESRIVERFRDFRAGGPECFVDTLRTFTSSTSLPLPAGDEVWYSCASGVQVEQAERGFLQRMPMDSFSAELSLLVPSEDGSGNEAEARLISARRGGTELYVTLLNTRSDIPGEVRQVQTVDVEFTAIAGIFLLTDNDPFVGDVILVFDRSSPPRLVPLQRPYRADAFLGPTELFDTNIEPLTLPADTHYAWFREDVGIRNIRDIGTLTSEDQETANVVVLRPTYDRGSVRFLRYETEQRAPGTSGFIDLDLRAADVATAALPEPGDRILFDARPQGDDVLITYGLTRSSHVWRFPVHRSRADNRVTEVQRARFPRIEDRPIGVLRVPRHDDHLWVAFSNRPSIDALRLVDAF